MKITSFDIYQYTLALKKPLYVRGTKVDTSRQGFLIHLKSESSEGIGESAPLPGLSTETLKDVEKELQSLRKALVHQSLPEHLEKLNGQFASWMGETKLSPSVQFGIETAVLNLMANSRHIPLYRLLTHSFHEHIRVQGLLHGSKTEILNQAKELVTEGFHELKLKVGENLKEDIEKVKALSVLIQKTALLHLDANQAWTLNDAIHFSNEVGLVTIDYIEEPFKNIQDIPEFFMKTTIPVALDESLLKTTIEDIRPLDGVETLNLKPTPLGGIEKAHQIMEKANRLAITTLISSSYESGVGILTLANLSGCTPRDRCAGLDTLKYFQEDILKEPIKIEHGKIDISQRRIEMKDIRFDLLKKIV